MSWWAILSLAPAVLAFAALLAWAGKLLGSETEQDVREEITKFLNEHAGSLGGDMAEALIDILDTPSGAIALIGFVVAVWSMSKGFAALFRGLAVIGGHPGTRTNMKGRLLGIAFGLATVLVVLVMLLSSVVGPLLGFEKLLPNDGGIVVTIWAWVRIPVLGATVVAWLAVLLSKGPGGGLRWREALPGAAFAAIGWIVLTLGFQLYVVLSGGGNPIYGVLGGILVALSWLYLLIVALVLGGLLNQVLVEHPRAGAARGLGHRHGADRRHGRAPAVAGLSRCSPGASTCVGRPWRSSSWWWSCGLCGAVEVGDGEGAVVSLPATTSSTKNEPSSVSSSSSPSTSALTSAEVRSSVGFFLRSSPSSWTSWLSSAPAVSSAPTTSLMSSGPYSGSPAPRMTFVRLEHELVLALGDAHHVADDRQRQGGGDVGDEVAPTLVEQVVDDLLGPLARPSP